MQEIPITALAPLRIGQAENAAAGTGCTVLLCPQGMRAGVDVRGGGPASRETQLLNPLMAAKEIHAVVLAGGSAFGLGAANGVMELLEQRGYGFDVGVTKVPLVVQSDLFDLTVGDPFVRPDAAMGYEAAEKALDAPNYRDGSYGAGCGATVGKIAGMETCMKTGMGSFAVQLGELKIGALVALNALGDDFDWRSGRQIAGLLTEDRRGLCSTAEYLKSHLEPVETASPATPPSAPLSPTPILTRRSSASSPAWLTTAMPDLSARCTPAWTGTASMPCRSGMLRRTWTSSAPSPPR